MNPREAQSLYIRELQAMEVPLGSLLSRGGDGGWKSFRGLGHEA